ncbi:MAG: hypothetical protein K5750_05555 [Eubacterium sp.]|nr:hypothetical protein [Eubacterium sp.]
MRKNRLTLILIMICLLACSITVYAKNEAVTINDDAEATTTSVAFSGSTKALAVMVQLRDADDEILTMESFGTVDGKFEGELENLELEEGAEYTLFIADYEGGDWATKTVKVPKKEEKKEEEEEVKEPEKKPTPEPTTQATTEATTAATTEATTEATTAAAASTDTNPPTGDEAPIMIAVMLLLASGCGIAAFARKKRS